MPQISVIVPVYNVEKYLHRCIDSILAQTFTDFELILVDDGSTDNCGAICDEYAAKDSRVRVIHQENLGQAAARNRAVNASKGKRICFVDADDAVHGQMLETLYYIATNLGVRISVCNAQLCKTLPKEINQRIDSFEIREHVLSDEVFCQLYDSPYFCSIVWGKLIDKNIVKSNPFEEGRIYEDNAIVCKWLKEAERVVYVDIPMYFYYFNEEGTTKKRISIKHCDRLWAIQEQIRFFESIGYDKTKDKLCARYIRSASELYKCFREVFELKDEAPLIKKQIRAFYRSRKKSIHCNWKERMYVFENLYPLLGGTCWRVISIVNTIKEQGIRCLLSKVKKRLLH